MRNEACTGPLPPVHGLRTAFGLEATTLLLHKMQDLCGRDMFT